MVGIITVFGFEASKGDNLKENSSKLEIPTIYYIVILKKAQATQSKHLIIQIQMVTY